LTLVMVTWATADRRDCMEPPAALASTPTEAA
jgi:hypothetical protein